MGINYKEIESNSVGNKEDYEMYSLDFDEYLWAKGYKPEQIDGLYKSMLKLTPLSKVEYEVMLEKLQGIYGSRRHAIFQLCCGTVKAKEHMPI